MNTNDGPNSDSQSWKSDASSSLNEISNFEQIDLKNSVIDLQIPTSFSPPDPNHNSNQQYHSIQSASHAQAAIPDNPSDKSSITIFYDSNGNKFSGDYLLEIEKFDQEYYNEPDPFQSSVPPGGQMSLKEILQERFLEEIQINMDGREGSEEDLDDIDRGKMADEEINDREMEKEDIEVNNRMSNLTSERITNSSKGERIVIQNPVDSISIQINSKFKNNQEDELNNLQHISKKIIDKQKSKKTKIKSKLNQIPIKKSKQEINSDIPELK